MTAVFSTYLRQFPAGENVQITGNIADRWRPHALYLFTFPSHLVFVKWRYFGCLTSHSLLPFGCLLAAFGCLLGASANTYKQKPSSTSKIALFLENNSRYFQFSYFNSNYFRGIVRISKRLFDGILIIRKNSWSIFSISFRKWTKWRQIKFLSASLELLFLANGGNLHRETQPRKTIWEVLSESSAGFDEFHFLSQEKRDRISLIRQKKVKCDTSNVSWYTNSVRRAWSLLTTLQRCLTINL